MSEISSEEIARLARKVDFQDLSLDELNLYMQAYVPMKNMREVLARDPLTLKPGKQNFFSREIETKEGKKEINFELDPSDPTERAIISNVANALEGMCEDRLALKRIPEFMLSLVQKK